jgi:hypothetical protein
LEFTIRPGEIFFGPVGVRHEVRTIKPSLSISANYVSQGDDDDDNKASASPLIVVERRQGVDDFSVEGALHVVEYTVRGGAGMLQRHGEV